MYNALGQFFLMGGYAAYVWSAYGFVLATLALQLFRPWRRWQHLMKKQATLHDD
jgi:heme exporter protein CcmD